MTSECNKYQVEIRASIDAESISMDMQRIFSHLSQCEHCRSYWKITTHLKSRILNERRALASSNLDRRVISAIQHSRAIVVDSLEGELHKTSRNSWSFWEKVCQARLDISYPFAVLISAVAITLGIILGVAEQRQMERRESTLFEFVNAPGLTTELVIGHINSSDHGGANK